VWGVVGYVGLTCVQGTLPFISCRILGAWVVDEAELHMAIDDMESFGWVVLWAGLHQSGTMSVTEKTWIDGLSADDMDKVAMKKHWIMTKKWPGSETFSKGMQGLLPLLSGWFSLARRAEGSVQEFIRSHVGCSGDEFAMGLETGEKLEGLCVDYYQQYMEMLVGFLED
jgi:hypothetical protein